MLNNIGPAGLIFLFLIIGLPIWLIRRSSKRKSKEQARIAEALEELAKSKK
jgi:flagellar biogenesis protein FliO